MSSATAEPSGRGRPVVTAVVLTYRRPRLASQVVRRLIEVDGVPPRRVIVVVNGEGGLDEAALESQVQMLRLPVNVGPAGGFAAGLRQATEDPATEWVYLCEDDVGLVDLPPDHLGRALALVPEEEGRAGVRIGAVAAYGRRFGSRPGHTDPFVPAPTPALQPVDVAAWGATLVHRDVVTAGILPDQRWFFGYEDFDFFLRMRSAGLSLVVDASTARMVAGQMSGEGREKAQAGARPTDAAEGWRAYYVARNFIALARLHGDRRWLLWHLVFSLRRIQLARSAAERWATLHGLLDGARGRLGPHPRYGRALGELPEKGSQDGPAQ